MLSWLRTLILAGVFLTPAFLWAMGTNKVSAAQNKPHQNLSRYASCPTTKISDNDVPNILSWQTVTLNPDERQVVSLVIDKRLEYIHASQDELRSLYRCFSGNGPHLTCKDLQTTQKVEDFFSNDFQKMHIAFRVLQALSGRTFDGDIAAVTRYWAPEDQIDFKLQGGLGGFIQVTQDPLTDLERSIAIESYLESWKKFGEGFIPDLAVQIANERDEGRKYDLQMTFNSIQPAFASGDIPKFILALNAANFAGREQIVTNFMQKMRIENYEKAEKILNSYRLYAYMHSSMPQDVEIREGIVSLLKTATELEDQVQNQKRYLETDPNQNSDLQKLDPYLDSLVEEVLDTHKNLCPAASRLALIYKNQQKQGELFQVAFGLVLLAPGAVAIPLIIGLSAYNLLQSHVVYEQEKIEFLSFSDDALGYRPQQAFTSAASDQMFNLIIGPLTLAIVPLRPLLRIKNLAAVKLSAVP